MKDKDLDHLRRQNELLRLELEWDREERRLVGGASRASAGTYRVLAVTVGAIVAIAGLLLMGLGLAGIGNTPLRDNQAPLLLIPGLGLVVAGVASGLFLWRRWSGYLKARARYQRRRDSLLGELHPTEPQKNLRAAVTEPRAKKRGKKRRSRVAGR